MTLAIILAVLALGVPLLLLRLAKGQELAAEILRNPGEHLRPVDIEAFRNLTDPEEEEFLRSHLRPAEFRKIQRERLRATVDYISCARDNAGILVRVGERARRSPDPETAQAGAKLFDDAIHLRMYAFAAIPKLYVAMVFPGRRIVPVQVAESYQQLTCQLARLGRQHPSNAISAAL